MRVFEHFALAAATGAFVRNDQVVVVRRHDAHRRAVHGDPFLALADVQQDAINPFLGAGAGIEVVAEQLVPFFGPVVHDDLLAAKIGVAERRRDVNHCARREVFGNFIAAEYALQQGQTQGEEAGIVRRDHQGMRFTTRHADERTGNAASGCVFSQSKVFCRIGSKAEPKRSA